MVSQNAMLQLVFQLPGKAGNSVSPFSHHLTAHGNMAQKLPFVRIVIFREIRQFVNLANVMAHGRRIQKIPIQNRICLYIIFTKLTHA